MAEGEADLNDDLLLAPIFVHNSVLKEKNNYSHSLPARTLTYWRYRAVWAFYSRAFLLSPRRTARTLWNLVRGREESKFDSFLQILKERFITRRSVKESSASSRAARARKRPPTQQPDRETASTP